jgi:hypothetical protein
MKLTGILCAIAGVLILTCSAWANYVQFQNPTDTISVAGNTVFANENQVTYEAIIEPTSVSFGSAGQGAIYSAWEYGAEDSHMFLDNNDTLSAYSFPIDWPNPLEGGTVPLNSWLDVAYVYGGGDESLYIDGNLVASKPAAVTLSGEYGGVVWPTNGDLSVGSGSVVNIGAADDDGVTTILTPDEY